MNIKIPSDAELWEAVAAIQVCQSQGVFANSDRAPDAAAALYAYAGLDWEQPRPEGLAQLWERQLGMPEGMMLDTNKAYREINSAKESYQAVLARVSGLQPKPIMAPRFPVADIQPSLGGGIIVCPKEVNDSFCLPWQVWKPIVRHLRSYGRPVLTLGHAGERMDYATFSEGNILSNQPMPEKMRALAAADLVVGVPNAWTWIATAWKKKIVIFHPDDVPVERWFGFDVAPRTLGRLIYTAKQLQVPVVLAGIRRLIQEM